MLVLSSLNEVCSSATMGVVLYIVKNILTILQIVAPILLIISLTIIFVNGTFNPDDKKLIKKIKNAVIATVLIFFMPLCFDLVMSITEQNLSFAKCYKNVNYAFKDKSATYIEIGDKEKSKITTDKSEYDSASSNGSSTSSSDYSTNGSGIIDAVKYMSDYVANDTKNTWYYKYSGSKKTFDAAVKTGTKNLTCVVLANWALKKVGVLSENQMVYQNPNTMEIKYKNGAKEAIKKHGNIYTWNSAVSFQYINKSIGLQPGDIIIYNYNHFNIYAGTSGTKLWFYSSGHDGKGHYKNGEYYFESFVGAKKKATDKHVIGLIRINK